ncbi:MAG: hypothetical protein GY794_16205 [bacterium]|nr:hypothetical protein [bacterium]
MTDKQFLNWIADRLVFVHGDPAQGGFVNKLRKIADASGPGPAAIPRIGEPVPGDSVDLRIRPTISGATSTGLKWSAGVFSVLVVVLLVWGALSI